jgi:hypothetical protein
LDDLRADTADDDDDDDDDDESTRECEYRSTDRLARSPLLSLSLSLSFSFSVSVSSRDP